MTNRRIYRVVISGLMLLLPLSGHAKQIVCENSLSLWQNGPVKRAIQDFVRRVTDPADTAYVPPRDRIVTIDMDGTLVCERPSSVGMVFAEKLLKELSVAPQLQGREPYETARRDRLGQMRKDHFELYFGLSGAGLEEDAVRRKVQTMVREDHHPRFNRPYRELFYRPMLQLVDYLMQNDFVIYVLSGSDQTLVRALCAERPELAGLPPARFIGTLVALDVGFADGKPVYYRLARELEPVNLRKGKALNILYRIGQNPILAIGNSNGDCGMLATTLDAGYPATLRMLLNHDDAGREYAYPRASGSDADMCREQAGADILSISMRDDFEQVFASESGP